MYQYFLTVYATAEGKSSLILSQKDSYLQC